MKSVAQMIRKGYREVGRAVVMVPPLDSVEKTDHQLAVATPVNQRASA